MRRLLLPAALAASAALAAPPTAGAVVYPVRCASFAGPGVKITRVSVTRVVRCASARTTVRAWARRGYTRRAVLGWFCDFDRSVGRDSRRASCTAGKEGGIAFTITYR